MKMRRTFPTLLMLLFATTIAATQPSSATAPDNGSAAFGQGSFEFFNPFRQVPQFEHWDFSFDAAANKKGHARGRATFNILTALTGQSQVVVKIDCMNVQESSGITSATITGTVLHSDNPNYPKGAEVIFGADDGSLSTFPFDIITPIFVIDGFEGDCHDHAPPLTMFQLNPDAITIEP